MFSVIPKDYKIKSHYQLWLLVQRSMISFIHHRFWLIVLIHREAKCQSLWSRNRKCQFSHLDGQQVNKLSQKNCKTYFSMKLYLSNYIIHFFYYKKRIRIEREGRHCFFELIFLPTSRELLTQCRQITLYVS